MLNRYGQLDAVRSDYEDRFGPAEEDFPLGSIRPRRPVKPAGRIGLLGADIESQPSTESFETEAEEGYSAYAFEVGPGTSAVVEVESIGGVATASMIPINTRPA
jgi:hypothetical protein